ncbi:Nucleoplasmin-like protein NO29-like [Scleropages formosus]|uniref:Nucleophosmin/nucleoplasmin, 3 n=1 Tax=Scleropages formosus TaxID=113540 RepID=A0A0P7TVX9_SCLFO|nr:nucleoplasmin-like protein NO29 [Scleropages formosus]KPP57856.1 Nucleoplasmin-like protein NO29-like [Scleropages formosus]
MSFIEEESSEGHGAGRSWLESNVFSCELSSKIPFYTFQGDDDDDLEHLLELRTVCLGNGAQEENNVVEVTALNHQGKKVSVPLANLHVSCLPMVSLGEFELKAPVTLRLKSGSGPVTVSGLHLVAYENSEEEESGTSEDEEGFKSDIATLKPAKKKQKL